ncbi:protein tweety homolog 2 isoform X4 [Chlorocebus sabaeus]|uniref:protein tweety homolog 2 isoform X4 n=1 Tax=Chlorocebus sabaeus TaxID=60711 RepID=UPI003BF96338
MQAARVDYIAPWWVVWLHSVPHLGLRLQPVNSTFNPGDESYQESLLFLGLVAAVCLGLNLIFLVAYLVCACCCQQDDAVQTKQRHSCCITWTAVVAGLVCCAAVGVGFYGNSETNDGVYQLMYSLEDANHTFSGIDALVSGTTQKMKVDLEQHLAQLSEIFAARGDYMQTLKFIQQMAGSVVVQLSGLPTWREVTMELTKLSDQTGYIEYYRWLSYLLLFILDLVICLMACLGLAKRSKCLLASMLCCGALSLLLSWASLAADAAAAVDYLDALAGTCYDGLQGLLYLGLFSFLAALAFSTMICAGPRAWKHFTTRNRDYDDIDDDDPFNPQAWRMAAHNPPRGQLHSFCSYSSGLGSQTSLQPPAQTISNAPVSEYMNQAMLFGRNPRYENVPLIGRASPPPTKPKASGAREASCCGRGAAGIPDQSPRGAEDSPRGPASLFRPALHTRNAPRCLAASEVPSLSRLPGPAHPYASPSPGGEWQ